MITAVSATATSNAAGSDPRNAIDGTNDGGFTDPYTETVWQSAAGAPQAIPIDLGATYRNIEVLTYIPPQVAQQQLTKDPSGRITGYGPLQPGAGAVHEARGDVRHRRHGEDQRGRRGRLGADADQDVKALPKRRGSARSPLADSPQGSPSARRQGMTWIAPDIRSPRGLP